MFKQASQRNMGWEIAPHPAHGLGSKGTKCRAMAESEHCSRSHFDVLIAPLDYYLWKVRMSPEDVVQSQG